MKNLVGIDKGALQLAINVLERDGKHEIVQELKKSCVDIEDVLKWYQQNEPATYMSGVTSDMIVGYT